MSTDIELTNDNVTVNSLEATTITATEFSGNGEGIINLAGVNANLFLCKTDLFFFSDINLTPYTNISAFRNTADLIYNVGGFTSSPSGIVVPETGIYLCMVNLKFESIAERVAPAVKFTINGTQQAETSATGYIRNLSNHSGSSLHLDSIYDLVSGDEIGLAIGQLGNSGLVTMQDENSFVSIFRMA